MDDDTTIDVCRYGIMLSSLGLALTFIYSSAQNNNENQELADQVQTELYLLSDQVADQGELLSAPGDERLHISRLDIDATSVANMKTPHNYTIIIRTGERLEEVVYHNGSLSYLNHHQEEFSCRELTDISDSCTHAKEETLRITRHINTKLPPRKDYNTRRH